MAFHVPEQFRVHDPLISEQGIGNNGAFRIVIGGIRMFAIASDGGGWEHVSVSLHARCPSWGEMCLAKDLFWDADDCVMQLHPPKSEWINCHPFCLHLWRPTGKEIPRPPREFVGPT